MQRPRRATVLTATEPGATTPTVTVYLAGSAPARALHGGIVRRALEAEGLTVAEEAVLVAETAAREQVTR